MGEEDKAAAPAPPAKKNTAGTPTSAGSRSAVKRPFSFGLIPAQAWGAIAIAVVALVGHVMMKSAALAEAERTWDPAPKGLSNKDVVILYCTSWQFEGAFRQVYKLINERSVEDLSVRGGHYPVPPLKQFYADMFQYLQLLLFFLTFAGEAICEYFGVEQPEVLQMLTANKMGSFMFIWMFGNMVQSSFMNSQAFEIYHGDNLVWSSLQNKRMPNYSDIIDGFKASGVEIMRSSVP